MINNRIHTQNKNKAVIVCLTKKTLANLKGKHNLPEDMKTVFIKMPSQK